MGKSIKGIIAWLLYTNMTVAQQIWPVQVTGVMIPPHSLNLGVYGAERSSDLTFNAMLKDPVQASLDVRLSLSIEQNGNVIYQTDPNYVGVPLTLSQFQNVLIDGNALRSYLNKEALTGANRTGTGSLEIPEGFNQICLQVYGLERNVPVSNKFCVSANFRLNQPPQFVKPSCGEKIKMTETQNMIFNWSPMHLGSPNSPGAVEYEFELVQLPQGTFNANDAFESALKVYTTKSMSPSLLYTQAEPRLIPNVVYAWRVKAASVLHPTSKLFQNDGLSQICTFMLYEGGKPTDDINPIDNPAPRGCEVFSTEYSPIDRSESTSQSVIEGDIVKVGYFNMKVTSASGGSAGYSGEGLVEYPMLKSLIPVTFQGVMVNSERRVYSADRIEAVVSPRCVLSDDQLQKNVIAQHVTNAYFTNKLLPEIQENDKYVRSFDANNLTSRTLPLAIGQRDDMPYVYVVGMMFTPSNAFLHLVSEDSKAGNAIYAATAIQATPYGVKNGAHLVPIIGAEYGIVSNKLPSLIVTNSESKDSRLNLDCSGVLEINVKKDYSINPELLVTSNNKMPVPLVLKDKRQTFEVYNGMIESVPEFNIVGVNNILFSSSGGILQINDQINQAFPADIKSKINSGASNGILLQGLSAKLPPRFNLGTGKELVLEGGNLFIGSEIIEYANLTQKNIIDIKDGKADKWQYSIHEMSIGIKDGLFEGPAINGLLKLPVASNTMDYSGSFDINSSENPLLKVNRNTSELDVQMWSSKMSLRPESIISASINNINNKYTILPSANLSGQLNMKMVGSDFMKSIKGNIAEVKSNFQSVFKINGEIESVSLEGLNIQNWNVDPYNPENKKYIAGNVDISKAAFTINGNKFKISDASILYKLIDGVEHIGLSFSALRGNSKMSLTMWAKDINGQFEFDHIVQNYFTLKCDCVHGESYGYQNNINPWDKKLNYNGSLASVSEKPEQEFLTNSHLNNLFGDPDFELKNNDRSLYWPLIDMDINIVKTDNKIISRQAIEIDQAIFAKLGFHTTYNIPFGSTLYLTEFEISDWKESGAIATIVLELKSPYNAMDTTKFMIFKSDPIQAKGSSIILADVNLYLQHPTTPKAWELENYSWKIEAGATNRNTQSYARMDCTSGFAYYNMQGSVTLKDMIQVGRGIDVEIPFELNTSSPGSKQSLYDFIAICKDSLSTKPPTKWNIHVKNQPQVSYTAGQGYEVYFDNSSTSKIPGDYQSVAFIKSTLVNEFKGVIFKNINCELTGFKNEKNQSLGIPIADAVYSFGESDRGLHSFLEAKDMLNKNAGAKISGWKYGLSAASFKISNSVFEQQLTLAGELSIPLFKAVPDKSIKSVNFDSSFVKFEGEIRSVENNAIYQLNSIVEFDDIVTKKYQSDFIPGLGFVLADDSSVELAYNNVTKTWDPKGTFNGIGMVLINATTASSFGLKYFPEGIDFAVNSLTFEGLVLNEGTGIGSTILNHEHGIKSINFGKWGVIDYAAMLKGLTEEEEDKDDKKTSNDPAKQDPSKSKSTSVVVNNAPDKSDPSSAKGTIVSNANGVGVVSKTSGSITRKKNVNSSLTQAAKTADSEKEPDFNGLKFEISEVGIKEKNGIFELGIGISLSMLGDMKEKKDGKDVSTPSLVAKGGVGIGFKINSGRFEPEGIALNCLLIEGELGPVKIKGGLNILTGSNNAGSLDHGSGFKAFLAAEMMGLGGIQAVGQFGKKDTYHYGFVDIEAFKQSGFAIPPPTPGNPPVIDLYGGGGGIRINMKSANPITNLALKPDTPNTPPDHCNVPDEILRPGVGFSQNYTPEKGTYGGNFYLIIGPWNELDNGPAPQYNLIAEPKIDIEISTDKSTNDLQFRKIMVGSNFYFKPESLGDRRDKNIADGFIELELNTQDRVLAGSFGMRMKVETEPLQSPLFQIPEDYSKTNFKTHAGYVGGLIVFSYDNRGSNKPFFNFKFGGSSLGSFKSKSGLPYNTAKFNVDDILNITAGAYFQIGADVDEIPPLKALIPQISDAESAKYVTIKDNEKTNSALDNGKGIAFGFKANMSGDKTMGPMSAKYDVGLGLNLLMTEKKSTYCADNTALIGMKGWYAQGQAFGYATGNVNLDYNFLFSSGRVSIMKLGAFVYLKANTPNPTNFSGRFNGNYNVLEGLISGSFDMQFELGKKCENAGLPSPIDGIYIYDKASIADGQRNVDRYADILLATNFALQKDFNLPQSDAQGNTLENTTFQADFKKAILTDKKSGTTVNLVIKYKSDKKGVNLSFDQPLNPLSEYTLEYTFTWKKWVNGKYIENFESGKKGDTQKQPKTETGIITFSTSDRPTTIVPSMVEYMAPGNGQRYWTSGYANTEIKFLAKAVNDAQQLFPDECSICSKELGKTVKYKYYVKIEGYLDYKTTPLILPITTRPSSITDKILVVEKKQVPGTAYSINALVEKNVSVDKVEFPELKNRKLTPGFIYQLSVIREPDLDIANLSQSNEKIITNKTDFKESGSITRNTLVNTDIDAETKINKIINEHRAILHTSYFAVSTYSSLNAKLQNLEVKHVRSTVKRRDFQHPNDVFDGQRAAAISRLKESKFHSVKDDYYAFNLKNGNSEGLDYFDLMRLKRNIKLNYTSEYIPETRIKYDRYGGKGIYNKFDTWLSGQTDFGNYMRKVLYDHTQAESKGIAQYGDSKISDGTKWHYKISGPSDPKALFLQEDEIAAKKLIHKVGFKSNKDPNYDQPVFEKEVEYDFLLQDLRSRIVINQMAWLSKMSNPGQYSDNWMENDLKEWRKGNHPEGEFLSENLRFNSFDWVLYGDSNKNNKGNSSTYIASEPGYQFSYHGGSTISFPSAEVWGELLESKRDKNESLGLIASFSPDRQTDKIIEQKVTEPNELVENYWYRIKVHDVHLLKVGDAKQAWSELWCIGYPYKNFKYGSGQYGIYSLGGGGWPSIREFREIHKPQGTCENVWNFTKKNSKFEIINEAYKNYNGKNPDETKYFPKVLDHGEFKFTRSNITPSPPTWLTTLVEVFEVSGVNFSPEKKYYIHGADGEYLKDKDGYIQWRIIQEGPFYRFLSDGGYTLKIDYYEKYCFLCENEKQYNIKVDDKKFSSDKYGDPNGYYRSVWAIVRVAEGSEYYFIKNVRYGGHFLHRENKVIKAISSTYGGQLIIREVK